MQSWMEAVKPLKVLGVGLLSTALFFGLPLAGETPQIGQTNPTAATPHNGAAVASPDPVAEETLAKMTHLREDERRKRLLADTNRLLALTMELKAEVDKATRDELSLEVIRKATEIEKLAHDVRERMKN